MKSQMLTSGTLLSRIRNEKELDLILVLNTHEVDGVQMALNCLPVITEFDCKLDLDAVLDESDFIEKWVDGPLVVLTDSQIEMPASIINDFDVFDHVTPEGMQKVLRYVEACSAAENGLALLQISEHLNGEGNIPIEDWEQAILCGVTTIIPSAGTNPDYLLVRERAVEVMLDVRSKC